MEKAIRFFQKPLFSDKHFLAAIWISIAVVGVLKGSGIPNNYFIFKNVFYHLLDEQNLYALYPELYQNVNLYGPVFGLIIAPFTFIPEPFGPVLWSVTLNMCLFFAIYYLPINWKSKVLIFYIPLHELFNCAANCQTNTLISALIIGSFVYLRKEKDFWAAAMIMLGAFIKVYGIMGLCFFFFSKHKRTFVISLFVWTLLFFILPMVISSPGFVVQCYPDWLEALSQKNTLNAVSFAQDISAIGLVRRFFGCLELSPLYILIPGMILFLLPYLNVKQYGKLEFQMGILSSALLFLVLFSTGSESPTYIIAMVGVAIWFVIQKRPYSKWSITLLLFAVLWTWLISSHIFPRSFRIDIVQRYALKTVGSFVIWIVLSIQLIGYKDGNYLNQVDHDIA